MLLVQRFYYTLKPYLPWRFRMALRRITARKKRETHRNIWPISERAAAVPPGWPGWPDNKRFALVLTHDVEGAHGLAKCRQLADLEINRGFVSSFNFIPEGQYAVTADFRHWLTENGFEVGVHDLEHDGRLFTSRSGFKAKALRINQYLRAWRASGFRSGFMLRNLGWLHSLDMQYDSSTFDTDPFELQPNGADTIFPFWIPSPDPSTESQSPFTPTVASGDTARARGGYVELPYTLPQDSTLYLVLRESTPDIWIRKLDWIARHGGMALVNVHPDYMGFDDGQGSPKEYPSRLFSEFLDHVSRNYAGQFWNPLPRELANWFVSTGNTGLKVPAGTSAPSPAAEAEDLRSLKGKSAAVVLYSYYLADPRPRRAAEALAQLGMEVEVLCLRQDPSEPREETVNGVRIRRLPQKRKRGGKLGYVWQYFSFVFATFAILSWRALGKRYSMVHVHNMPDVLVFSALVPKLRGAKVILDLHDPMPELMMTIFGIGPDSFGVSLLKRLERWSIGVANVVITVNEACRTIFSARSCRREKVRVIMNSPDEHIFAYRELPTGEPAARDPNKAFAMMYHGSLVERHGLDVAVEALKQIKPDIPGAELWVYGHRTAFLDNVLQSVENTDLAGSVRFFGPKKLEQIAEAIRTCDVGVIPNRRSIFTELNTPTRIFEYLSQGKPVIAPRAQGILDYFGSEDLVYFELGDAGDLARQMAFVYRNPEAVATIVQRGQKIYRDHRWSSERKRFAGIVHSLLGIPGGRWVEATARPAEETVGNVR